MSVFRSAGRIPSPATDEQIARAEQELGCALPHAYKDLLREQNGGYLARTCFATPFRSSWAETHVAVQTLRGVGDADLAIDGELGSRYVTDEWDYPDIGLVVFGTPSGGHDTVMLDYTRCGPDGEPAVAYVDEDRVPRIVAPTLAEFLAGLTTEDAFDSPG